MLFNSKFIVLLVMLFIYVFVINFWKLNKCIKVMFDKLVGFVSCIY